MKIRSLEIGRWRTQETSNLSQNTSAALARSESPVSPWSRPDSYEPPPGRAYGLTSTGGAGASGAPAQVSGSVLLDLWNQKGLQVSEKASLPRRDGDNGGLGRPIRSDGSEMFMAVSPLYGQDSREPWFRGTEARALDVTKIKELTGGRMPEGAELAALVKSHPEVTLAQGTFDKAGVLKFNAPPGHEVAVWTGCQGVTSGGSPTQAMAMVGRVNDVTSPRIREAIGASGPAAPAPAPSRTEAPAAPSIPAGWNGLPTLELGRGVALIDSPYRLALLLEALKQSA